MAMRIFCSLAQNHLARKHGKRVGRFADVGLAFFVERPRENGEQQTDEAGNVLVWDEPGFESKVRPAQTNPKNVIY